MNTNNTPKEGVAHHLEFSGEGCKIRQQLHVIRERQPCPAVNHQQCPRHVGGQRAGQVEHAVGDLRLVPQPLEGGAGQGLAEVGTTWRVKPCELQDLKVLHPPRPSLL